jgi:hypothetical protein
MRMRLDIGLGVDLAEHDADLCWACCWDGHVTELVMGPDKAWGSLDWAWAFAGLGIWLG